MVNGEQVFWWRHCDCVGENWISMKRKRRRRLTELFAKGISLKMAKRWKIEKKRLGFN